MVLYACLLDTDWELSPLAHSMAGPARPTFKEEGSRLREAAQLAQRGPRAALAGSQEERFRNWKPDLGAAPSYGLPRRGRAPRVRPWEPPGLALYLQDANQCHHPEFRTARASKWLKPQLSGHMWPRTG